MKQPYSDGIVAELKKTIAQYDEGAIVASEVLYSVVIAYGNWEKEVIAEHDAMMEAMNTAVETGTPMVRSVGEDFEQLRLIDAETLLNWKK